MSEHNEQRASREVERAWRAPRVRAGRVVGRVVSDRRGASLLELLIVVAIVALGGMAAMRTLSGAMSDAAGGQQKAIAALSAVGGGSAPGDARPPTSPPPAPAPPKPAPKKDDGGWGLPGWVKDVGSFALDLTPIGDIKTLMDPDASLFDKVLAGTSLATSVIPGVGQAVKGVTTAVKVAKAVDKAADAGKAIDKARDAEKAVDKARDAKKAAEEAEDGSDLVAGGKRRKKDEPEDCADGVCKNGTCFAAGTPVHTEHGLRPIEHVSEGERVWSRSDRTGELTLQPVVHRFVTPNRVLLGIDLDDGSGELERLRVTPPHPFWTQRGWVAAGDLTLDDEVMLRSGAWAMIASAETLDEGATVYNFEVQGFHTYFVGTAGAWVHNGGPKPDQGGDCPEARSDGPVYKTDKEATAAAGKLGFKKVPGQRSHGQAVFTDGKRYISRDVDGHNGGAWKMAGSVRDLASKKTRSGTYDVNLDRVGD